MKIYAPEFSVLPDTCPYPRPAISFNSVMELMDDYGNFCYECDRWGQNPAPVQVYIGEPSGEEAKYGYPDYPDYVIEREDDRIVIKNA